jgi:glycosyltransferase involved in cell wall biosynthesis
LEKLHFGEAKSMTSFEGRVGIVQRVLPRYRSAFFDLLATQCKGGLGVFAGMPRSSEHIPSAEKLSVAKWTQAQNQHLFKGPFYLCRQKGLTEWLDAWEPDVLIVEANPRYVSTPTAIEIMKSRSRPVIGWGLGSRSPKGPLAGLRLRWRQRFLRQFDAMIAYSQRGAAEYRSLGVPAERVFVAPNAATQRPESGIPKREKKTANQLTILFVGRIQPRKRLDALLQACSSLPIENQPVLQIVGDVPAMADLKNLAQRIYPKTEFKGAKFGADLDQLFDSADLFVLPGTGGLAIQQAMAHGLPVIAAEGDGSQEDLVGAENGWLIKPNDDSALRNALSDALSSAERLSKMGEKSFELVQSKFNLENMVEAFINAINKVKA